LEAGGPKDREMTNVGDMVGGGALKMEG